MKDAKDKDGDENIELFCCSPAGISLLLEKDTDVLK